MLSINQISYHIGARTIFNRASLHIRPGDKIGLIGLNGAGKSTLLRMIDGQIQPDEGAISRRNDCTIGFLDQDLLSYESHESILAVAMEAFKETAVLETKIEEILGKMESEYDDGLVEELAGVQEKYEAMGGYTLQSRAEEILEGIGFRTADLHRPLTEFSGGWRMRVMLAKLLLEKPSLLMLDEPTNHLDLPSIIWLEKYLRNYPGAVIVVSHDRRFLDNTVKQIIEVSGQRLNLYNGNYSFYLREKEMRNEIQKNAFANQQQKIRQTERFIERFRAKATKSRQVQSRIKSLERMEKIEDVVDHQAAVHFNFHIGKPSGRHVATLEKVTKRYGDFTVFENTSIQIERNDKIALVGANGEGKSTLLRIITGTEPVEGASSLGYNVIPSFYAQHQIEALNLDNEILDELKQSGSGRSEQELRNILGSFLFSGDDVFKKIKVLSGGERSRVALAKVLISDANFLLLDEPTNHLDMQSVNILTQALQHYEGTFIAVSHDRNFISRVANKIWYIEDLEVKEYPGTFEEYLLWRESKIKDKAKTPAIPSTAGSGKKKRGKTTDEKRQRNLKSRLLKLHAQLEKTEQQIDRLEQGKKILEDELSKPGVYGDPEKFQQAHTEFEKTIKKLDEEQENWNHLVEEIDGLELQLQGKR